MLSSTAAFQILLYTTTVQDCIHINPIGGKSRHVWQIGSSHESWLARYSLHAPGFCREQSVWYQLWEVAHSAPMEVPWPPGTCLDYAHFWPPLASESIPKRSPHRHQQRITTHPQQSVNMHQLHHSHTLNFLHSTRDSWCPLHNLMISLPHHFYTPISWQ